MTELKKLVAKSIQILKDFQPENENYYVCYSGGKDSDCIRILCELAGVNYDLVHNHTTADAPETIYYVRSIPCVQIEHAYYKNGTPKTMWNLIVKKKYPPTRIARYCCAHLKEVGGVGRLKVTGVRAYESKNRADNNGLVTFKSRPVSTCKLARSVLSESEFSTNKFGNVVLHYDNPASVSFTHQCYATGDVTIQPIIDWTDKDVWDFLHYYGCKSNPLYECGFKRIGCIGCPIGGAKSQYREFGLYPKIKANYIRAFDRMVKASPHLYPNWKTGLDVFQWWLGEMPGQMSFFDEELGGLFDG